MATRKIPDIAPESRRWVNEEEAIGLLNITRREWEEFFKEHASVYVGKNYDMTQLHRMMERQVVVNRSVAIESPKKKNNRKKNKTQ